jgi:hypothetical protein
MAAGTSRHKGRVQARLTGSWLAALPVKTPLLQEVSPLPLAVVAPVLLAIGVALIGGLPQADARDTLLAFAGGAICGFIAGWHWRRTERVATPGSWYASMRRVRGAAMRPTLLPLGYWALARMRVWGRPQVTARQVLVVLLAVPMGAPAAQALAAVAATLIAWHLLALLAAVMRVAFAAAWWLAPTPIRVGRLTAALVQMAWLRQGAVCALALLAVALGKPVLLQRTATLAIGWLALCVISGSVACLIAWHARAHGAQFGQRGWRG